MSFIEVALDESVKERSAVPEARYPLVVLDFSDKESGKGSAMLTIVHEIEGEPDAAPVKHWITLPTKGDDADTIRMKQLGMKRYLTMAGIPFEENGFDTDDLIGASFDADLSCDLIEEDKDGNPIDRPYEVNRIAVPFLQDEE